VSLAARALSVVGPSAGGVRPSSASVSAREDRDPSRERTLGMLFVTRRCNLDCSYCHMEHETIPDTPIETLQKGIDLLLAYSDATTFHWFGGEPLLRKDLIEWGVDYIEKHRPAGHRVEHFLTTNGLLLHRHIDWLAEKEFGFMLSIDGSFESQEPHRKAFGHDQRAAYEKILGCIDLLNERGLDYFCNMCVSPENVDRMVDNARFLMRRGVKRVQLGYELGALWDARGRSAYLAGLEAAIRELHDQDGFRIQNGPYSEPVLGNPFFVVDCNGDMFQGCAVVLERTLPTFNDTARLGHISEVDSLVGRQRDRLGQVRYFLRGTRPNQADWVRLRSNMHLGYLVRRLLLQMGHNV